METSQSGQSEGPPYLSFGELKNKGVRIIFSPVTERLYWEFDGVFPTAISVMKSYKGASDDLEPFFNPDTGTWHEISQLPLAEPKVSSLKASVYDLDQWEFDWVAYHEYHNTKSRDFGQEYVPYESLDDDVRPQTKEQKEDGSWEEDSETEFLIKCCGEDRPLRKRGLKLVVTASQSTGIESFVTVRDFVSAVHPWLMSLRGDILEARSYSREDDHIPTERYEWMVEVRRHCGGKVEIEEKRDWVRRHSPRMPGPLTASDAKMLERIRANMAEKRAMWNEGGIPPF